eukprot:4408865-Amphidinium_carterae.1
MEIQWLKGIGNLNTISCAPHVSRVTSQGLHAFSPRVKLVRTIVQRTLHATPAVDVVDEVKLWCGKNGGGGGKVQLKPSKNH